MARRATKSGLKQSPQLSPTPSFLAIIIKNRERDAEDRFGKWSDMKTRFAFVAIVAAVAACLLLTCCAKSEESLPVTDGDYAEYAGAQFSGEDPWGGKLTVTVLGIVDGKMSWTFTDAFEGHTLYAELKDTPVVDGVAEYDAQGKDVESDNITFSYQGSLELKDGQISFTFEQGSMTTKSSEGDSDSRMAEALEGSGASNQIVLAKTPDESLTTYTVKEGDSIHSIAEEHGISTRDLAIINQAVIVKTAQENGYEFDDVIKYAEYLFPGEVLLVPSE